MFGKTKTSGEKRANVLSVLAASAAMLAATMTARAGEAATSASAGTNGAGPGTASASAAYNGSGPSFVKTKTRSGQVNFGQGVAFGFDGRSVQFSASHAIASRYAPAMASTFNVSIGLDGKVATSHGVSTASGSPVRSAHAGGFAASRAGNSTAGATAGGHTWPSGRVRAWTDSRSRRVFPRR